ncbi:MAG: nuclear transport factor 2 family protein [Chitinophagaceae bacterium]
MKFLLPLFTFLIFESHAQSDEAKVKAVIETLFRGIRSSDTALMQTVLSNTASLQTVAENNGQVVIQMEPISRFLASIAKPHAEPYDERITFDAVHIDGPLASVWTPYKFYVGTRFNHCGVNSFQLVKLNGTWKIHYIVDTRRTDNCL